MLWPSQTNCAGRTKTSHVVAMNIRLPVINQIWSSSTILLRTKLAIHVALPPCGHPYSRFFRCFCVPHFFGCFLVPRPDRCYARLVLPVHVNTRELGVRRPPSQELADPNHRVVVGCPDYDALDTIGNTFSSLPIMEMSSNVRTPGSESRRTSRPDG
jgi:hypothetical protein